jgi:hypothetical protein
MEINNVLRSNVTSEDLGDDFIYSVDENYNNLALRIGGLVIGTPTAEQKKKAELAKKRREDKKAAKAKEKDAAKKDKKELIANRKKIKSELMAKGGDWRKEWRKVRKEYGGSAVRKGLQFQNTLALVPNRNAFLALLRLNTFNMAFNLAKHKEANDSKWAKAINKWQWLGGDLVALRTAIEAGKNKKPVFAKYKGTGQGFAFDGSWVSEYEPATFSAEGIDDAAYITLASSIIGVFGKILSSSMDKKTAEAIKETASIELEKIQLTEEQKLDIENTMDDEDDEWIIGLPNWATITIGVALLGAVSYGVYYAIKK